MAHSGIRRQVRARGDPWLSITTRSHPACAIRAGREASQFFQRQSLPHCAKGEILLKTRPPSKQVIARSWSWTPHASRIRATAGYRCSNQEQEAGKPPPKPSSVSSYPLLLPSASCSCLLFFGRGFSFRLITPVTTPDAFQHSVWFDLVSHKGTAGTADSYRKRIALLDPEPRRTVAPGKSVAATARFGCHGALVAAAVRICPGDIVFARHT